MGTGIGSLDGKLGTPPGRIVKTASAASFRMALSRILIGRGGRASRFERAPVCLHRRFP